MPPPTRIEAPLRPANESLPTPKLKKPEVNTLWDAARTKVQTIQGQAERILNSGSNLAKDLPPEKQAELDVTLDIANHPKVKIELALTLDQQQMSLDQPALRLAERQRVWDNTQKMISEVETQTQEGLIIETDGTHQGRYSVKENGKVQIKSIQTDVTPSIQTLRRLSAEKDSEGAQLYQQLVDNDVVSVEYTDPQSGSKTTAPLSKFDELIDKEAENLWTHDAQGKMTYADAKEKFPQVAAAYQLRAEQKIDSDAKYSLHYAPDTSTNPAAQNEISGKPQEQLPPLTPEEIRQLPERVLSTSDNSISAAFKAIIEKVKNGTTGFKLDMHLANLFFVNDRLAAAIKNPSAGLDKDFLACLTSRAQQAYYAEHPDEFNKLSPEMQTAIKQDEAQYAGKDNPWRKQIHDLVESNIEDLNGSEIETFTDNIDLERFHTASATLQKAIQAEYNSRGTHNPQALVGTAIQAMMTGGLINVSEAKLLERIYDKGNGIGKLENISSFSAKQLGIQELYNLNTLEKIGKKIPLADRLVHPTDNIAKLMIRNLDKTLERTKVKPENPAQRKAIEDSITLSPEQIAEYAKSKKSLMGIAVNLVLMMQFFEGLNLSVDDTISGASGGSRGPH